MKAYTTEKIDRILGQDDYSAFKNVTYRLDKGFRKPGLKFSHTFEELQEYAACKNDPIYFMEKYCEHYDNIKGKRSKIVLRPYQKTIINNYFKHNLVINAVSRQVGMTTVVALLIVYEMIFSDKKIALVHRKFTISGEKIQKVRDFYRSVPYFLKPGVKASSAQVFELENGSSVNGFSDRAFPRGLKFSSTFFDDAAFIENLEVFTESFQQSDKVFLSSVPNGPNFFRELFIKAVSGENDFVPCGVYWWEVPGRDEVWKMKEIENLGSDSFRQEYELGFL